MVDHEQILKGMEVVDIAEVHVGIVEHHEGKGFRLSHRDAPDHRHHYVPHHWVAKLDDRVHLARSAADVFDGWPGGHPSGRADPAGETRHKPFNWKIWGTVGAAAVGLLLLLV